MILTLYLSLIFLALVCVGLGLTLDEHYFTMVGLFFLFSLGILLLSGSLEYKIGNNSTVCDYEEYFVYGNNFTDYHWDYNVEDAPACANPNDWDCVHLFHTVREYDPDCVPSTMYVYQSLGEAAAFWYGFLMALSSGFGMFSLLWSIKTKFKKASEEEGE